MKSFVTVTRFHPGFFFILIMHTITGSLFAQTGYFADNPVWKLQSSCAVPLPCIEYRLYNNYINGDTLINGHTYSKLFSRITGNYTWMAPPPPISCQGSFSFNDTVNPIGYNRDTLNLIYYMPAGNPESLLYDFNLQVGDTLPLTFNNYQTDITVAGIDSILIGSNYRKRFELSPNSASHYLVEGIGHDHGFLENFPPILECGFDLLCYGFGDTAWYPATGPGCNILSGMEETSFTAGSSFVYPNPSTGTISLNAVDANEISMIRIFNTTGQQVYLHHAPASIKNIDISPLDAGFYCLVILKRKGPSEIIRFIRE